ncbi:CGNR zinc finger domain-containing protein [Clostridiaceae bacterium 35-E11]
MDGKIDLVGNFATDWIKYSDYEIKTTSAGEIYIIPSEEAVFSMYNPFNVAEDLLLSLISIGDKGLQLEKEMNEENKIQLNNEILIFAKKYGLLGLISASAYNRNIIGDEKVLLIENNYITKEKIMDENSYLSKFIPFTEEGDIIIKKYRNCVDIVKREDSPKFYGKRPVVLDLVFSKFYSEKINWMIDFAKMIALHFNHLLVYKNTSVNLTENVTIMAGKFHAEKIGFTINQLDKTTIAWQFDSLKTAVETIYAFAVTDETIAMDRCKHCDKVFIANNIRSKYCSTSCRNRANVQKSRERKSNK